MPHPKEHIAETKKLAENLSDKDVYEWFVTQGYFPESYVLPPCFYVSSYPNYGTIYAKDSGGVFKSKIAEVVKVHFPKTELTDRTFGIIDPEIHSDIAYYIASNWSRVVDSLFRSTNSVYSYSFPLPITAKVQGKIGNLRSGRMIYEFIEMAENDLASIAYNYKYIVKTDIKNFYPSIYTHSISWALHGKSVIRKKGNRENFSFLGNKLDKLFQYGNDQITNGISVGPAISDLISEIILASVDCNISERINNSAINAVLVRFKDDYRILCNSEPDGKAIVKYIQSALKEYNLELNDEKTKIGSLPDGLFREWVSLYYAINPHPKRRYTYKRFKEVYLSVIEIDKKCPGTGVIDRFLADIVNKKREVNIRLDKFTLPKTISLLLLARRRIKTFPKVLAIIELILKSPLGIQHSSEIVSHLEILLEEVAKEERENKYLII